MPRSWSRWLVGPLLVAELLLLVAVFGGVSAWRDGRTLTSSSATQVTATVTRTSRSCRGGCAYESYGSYTVGGRTEHDVELECCADRPLAGRVAVRVASDRPRHPVLVGSDGHGAEVLGVAAAVVLVAGNVAVVVALRRRRAAPG